jgi:hypothetical protein
VEVETLKDLLDIVKSMNRFFGFAILCLFFMSVLHFFLSCGMDTRIRKLEEKIGKKHQIQM